MIHTITDICVTKHQCQTCKYSELENDDVPCVLCMRETVCYWEPIGDDNDE